MALTKGHGEQLRSLFGIRIGLSGVEYGGVAALNRRLMAEIPLGWAVGCVLGKKKIGVGGASVLGRGGG